VDETKPNQTPNQTQPPTPGIWKEGAKALAAFQANHQGVAKGGLVDGGPRKGNKYANLLDVLRVAAQGAQHGLSHTGQARLLGDSILIYRAYLHHVSGESIYTEHFIGIRNQGMPGQVQQDLGAGLTYARKYCLQELYGLYADDGLDPDEVSYADSEIPAPAPVAAPEQQQQPVVVTSDDGQTPITDEQKAKALEIVKENAEIKAAFMKQYHPKVTTGMTARMLTLKEHHDFIVAPF
jgi:hypothetical protein